MGVLASSLAVLASREIGESVLGGGYGVAQAAITGADWVGDGLTAAGVLALLAVVKLLAATLTVGTGGSAGAFGPTFAIGALLGGSFGQLARYFTGDPTIDPGAFALVGMGALFGGVAHAPLGSLVMVCELCGSYDLLVPLMLAEGIAFVTLRRSSLYTAQKPTKQDSPAHPPRVMEVLSRMKVHEVMKMPGPYVRFELGTPVPVVLRKVGDCGWQDAFPVFDGEKIAGMITPEMLRVLAAERELEPWLLAADAMQPAVLVHENDDLRVASELMLTDGLREVIAIDDDGKIVGFVDEAEVGQV
ncbi:MAG: chloride channel protein, partial [Planctomycetota bacterium]